MGFALAVLLLTCRCPWSEMRCKGRERERERASAKAEINIPRVPKAAADNMRAQRGEGQENVNEETKKEMSLDRFNAFYIVCLNQWHGHG